MCVDTARMQMLVCTETRVGFPVNWLLMLSIKNEN